MSASMAEGIAGVLARKAMLDHRVVWELDPDDETLVARCDSCGYLGSELETFEHQANVASEILAANGYGKLDWISAATDTSIEALIELHKAAAWDEGYTTGNAHNGRRDANPYRSDK